MSVHSGVRKHHLLTIVLKCVRVTMEFSDISNAV